MFQRKIAFTLAEIMIVLTIIGILTAILLPIANHSRPDENVMKFKKADTTLKNVIRELINSNKYYLDGDLGIRNNGTVVDSATYLCQSIADILSIKKVNCSEFKFAILYTPTVRIDLRINEEEYSMEKAKKNLDISCKDNTQAGEEIITADNIVFYQTSPGHHFGTKYTVAGCYKDTRYFGGTVDSEVHQCSPADKIGNFIQHDSIGADRMYKVFCIDIDGIPSEGSANCDDVKDICPFGYGIRADGKILTGARADEWLEKGFQKGANDN